jgi:RNA polymerase sigma-70 factor (ECF subfamily)
VDIRPSEYEELERRVAQRDQRAFDELHRAYERMVHFFVLSKVNSPRLAAEMTSDVFDRAWERIDRYRWQDWSFHVWVLRIAREKLDERGYRQGSGTS